LFAAYNGNIFREECFLLACNAIQPQDDFRRDNAGGGAVRRRNIGIISVKY